MDFHIGKAPYPFPARCVYCGDTRKLLVSAAEIPGYGAILSCDTCDRAKATARGYAKGKKMEELVNADLRLAELEKELTERDHTIRKQLDDATVMSRHVAQLQEIIEGYRGRERQQEHLAGILSETARQMVEVRALTPVGDAA